MNAVFRADYYRMTGKKWGIRSWLDLITRYDLRYLLHIRSRRNVLFTLKSLRASRKYGLEILSSDIGEGLYIGHAHNINVHPQAVIGKNCNMNKGCTVGRENRGKRNGAPTIGQRRDGERNTSSEVRIHAVKKSRYCAICTRTVNRHRWMRRES